MCECVRVYVYVYVYVCVCVPRERETAYQRAWMSVDFTCGCVGVGVRRVCTVFARVRAFVCMYVCACVGVRA